MNKVIDEYEPELLLEEDKEFEKYCKLYEEKFGKKTFITKLNDLKQQIIDTIKTCLKNNKKIIKFNKSVL